MITYVKETALDRPSQPYQSRYSHLKGVIGGGGSRYMIDELNRGA